MKKISWPVGAIAVVLAASNFPAAAAAGGPARRCGRSGSDPRVMVIAIFTPPGANPRVIGVHSVMLHTGKVLPSGNLRPTQGYVYDPVTGKATETDPPADC